MIHDVALPRMTSPLKSLNRPADTDRYGNFWAAFDSPGLVLKYAGDRDRR